MKGIRYLGDPVSLIFFIVILLLVGRATKARSRFAQVWADRIAVAVFAGYLLVVGIVYDAASQERWSSIAFYALLAAGLALGAAWVVLPIVEFLHMTFVRRPIESIRFWRSRSRSRRVDRKARREAERRAALERDEWERQAPERERARQQAEVVARTGAEAQRRRMDARRKALLDYVAYAPKLGDRFSRATFDEYVSTYMGDKLAPEDVERSGRELLAIFERHLADAQPPVKEQTIDGLTEWYQATRQKIERSAVDDRTKRAQIQELYARYTELMSELIEGMRP